MQGELQEFERKVIFPTKVLPNNVFNRLGVSRSIPSHKAKAGSPGKNIFVKQFANTSALDRLDKFCPSHQTHETLMGWLLALAVTALIVYRYVPKVSMWRRQIEAHALNCLRAQESLLAYSSSGTPDSCCLRRKPSPARQNPKSLNAFWFSFRIDVLTWLDVLGILLLKHQTSSLIQLKHLWDGFLLWLWLRLLFTDTFLKFPCEGGRLKHMPWSVCEHKRACLPTPVQGLPIAAAWEGNHHLHGRTPRAWMPFDSASE